MIIDSNELPLAKTLVSATEVVLASVKALSGNPDCHVLCRNNDSLVRFDVGVYVSDNSKCRTFIVVVTLVDLNLDTLPLIVKQAYE